MKSLVVALLVCSVGSWAAFAQGTVNFANIGVGLNAPVFLNDGVTKAGADYSAALLAGPSASNLAQIATTPLLSGTSAGYFLGGAQTIPTVTGGGTAWVLVEVWNSALYSSFPAALAGNTPNAAMESAGFSVVTGNPNAVPPGLPATLTGLRFSGFTVPEPSEFVLTAIAVAMVFFVRHR